MSKNANHSLSSLKLTKLLKVQQVADVTGFSVREVRRWIKSGDLPASKFGRALRVSEPDVAMFIASKKYS